MTAYPNFNLKVSSNLTSQRRKTQRRWKWMNVQKKLRRVSTELSKWNLRRSQMWKPLRAFWGKRKQQVLFWVKRRIDFKFRSKYRRVLWCIQALNFSILYLFSIFSPVRLCKTFFNFKVDSRFKYSFEVFCSSYVSTQISDTSQKNPENDVIKALLARISSGIERV